YAGISNYRFHEAHRQTGITLEQWERGKRALIAKKLLNRAGAATNDGRNVEVADLYCLAKEEPKDEPAEEVAKPQEQATLLVNECRNRHELRFPNIPPTWVRKGLKERDWRWDRDNRCWHIRRGAFREQTAVGFAYQFVKKQEAAA
ncbi:hypothetical protein AMJ85_11125, partial [candidate division BRC1 bacterium SM23_51]